MRELLITLKQTADDLIPGSELYEHVAKRYKEVETAIQWWNELLEN